jgi:putative oxidoreductase
MPGGRLAPFVGADELIAAGRPDRPEPEAAMWDPQQSFDLTSGINILRIVCGLFIVPHLFVKFRNQDFVRGFFDKVGLKPAMPLIYLTFAIEIVAVIGLVLGIYTTYVAVLAGVFMLVAAWASWKYSDGKWIWTFGGAEYPLFWAIACFVVAMEA